MDPLTQLDQLGPPLGGVVAGITPDQLDRPTPCADFTVRGVLEHMIGGATAFAAAFRGETPAEPDLERPARRPSARRSATSSPRSARPGRSTGRSPRRSARCPATTFARFVVLDGLVHGWDLATATGQPYDPPDDLVAAVDAFARQVARPAARRRRPSPTPSSPPPAPPPSSASAAFTGRRPLRRSSCHDHHHLTLDDLEAIKEKQQATWASGDYAVIGTTLQIVGESLCEAVDVAAGWQVLDVAAGNGNASLAAARRGCDVTATDYVDALLDRARRRAEADGLPARRPGSPTPRPCRSRTASFDAVLSTFGVMFTPNPERAAAELRPGVPARRAHRARQLDARGLRRPDVQDRRRSTSRRRPGVPSPLAWGTEDRLAGAVRRATPRSRSTRRHFTFRYRSAEDFFETFKDVLRPDRAGVGGARRRRPGVAPRPARRAGRRAPTGTRPARSPSTPSTSRSSPPATTADADAGQPGPVTPSWWAPQMKTARWRARRPGSTSGGACRSARPCRRGGGAPTRRRRARAPPRRTARPRSRPWRWCACRDRPAPCGRAGRAAPCSARPAPRRCRRRVRAPARRAAAA